MIHERLCYEVRVVYALNGDMVAILGSEVVNWNNATATREDMNISMVECLKAFIEWMNG